MTASFLTNCKNREKNNLKGKLKTYTIDESLSNATTSLKKAKRK
jgi:hypothetical protein